MEMQFVNIQGLNKIQIHYKLYIQQKSIKSNKPRFSNLQSFKVNVKSLD